MKKEKKTVTLLKFIIAINLIVLFGCHSKKNIEKLDSLLKLAMKTDSLEDFKSSIIYYNQILEIDNENIVALENRGTALIHTSEIEAGFIDINKAIELCPNEQTYYNRCLNYLYLNKLDSAEMDLNRAKKFKLTPSITLKSKTKKWSKNDSFYSEINYTSSRLALMKGDTFLALHYCYLGDEIGLNKIQSKKLKAEISKKYGEDIVSSYNYNKILQIVDSLPSVKKAVMKSISDDKLYNCAKIDTLINGYYKIVFNDEDTKYTFKMNAVTLKVLNPDGRNIKF